MAQTILASILSPKNLKIVDEKSGLQIWSSLSVKSVQIESSSDNADIPFAVGDLGDTKIVDETTNADLKSGKVMMPTRLVLSGFVGDSTLISSLLSTFMDVTHSVTITSRSIISKNMGMVDLSIIQDKDNLSQNKIEITFEQAQPSNNDPKKPIQPADENAAGVTVQSPADLTTTVTDLYNKVKSAIGV